MKKTITHLTLALTLMLMLSMSACGSSRSAIAGSPAATAQPAVTATAAPSAKETRLNTIATSFGSWSTMKAGGSVSLSGGQSLSSSMQMRMIRDKSIYISVRPLGMVEVAKMIITGDTLIVVDKLHKRYLCENVKLLTAGVPATVSTLQDIFLGRAFILGKGTLNSSLAGEVTLTHVDGSYMVQPKQQYEGFTYDFKFDPDNKILSLEVTPAAATASTYAVGYSDVRTTAAGRIAGRIDVATRVNKTDFKLKLEYGGITWNEAVKIDTQLPVNYKRIAGASLLNMLGQQ